jgi:hypothetical protein
MVALSPVLEGDVGGLRVLLAPEALQLFSQHTPEFEPFGDLEPASVEGYLESGDEVFFGTW